MNPHLIFVDTSAFYALADSDDARHSESVEIAQRLAADNASLCATNFVLSESYGLTLIRLGRTQAQKFLATVRDSPVEILRVTTEDERTGESILEQYADQTFSYVDATSFAVVERLDIKHVFAFDSHFSIFRPRLGPLIVNS